jgi:flagellar hook-associated protein 3 FlgL
MRVTQSEIYRNFLSDIERFNENLNSISRQVSSGKKLNQLKDSPAGAAKLVSLTDLKAEIDQYSFNIDAGTYSLQTADSALNEVNNLVTSIYAKGSNAASESVNDDARAPIAFEIRTLRDQILSLANTQANGRYIFAGTKTASAPYVLSGDTVTYQGDANVNTVTVDNGTEVNQNVQASGAFSSIFSAIDSLLTGVTGNDVAGIRAALGQFSAALSALGQVRGVIGANLSLLQDIKPELDSRSIDLKQQQSQVQDANMAEAAVQLQQNQTALNAAVTAAGSLLPQRNLFDILG